MICQKGEQTDEWGAGDAVAGPESTEVAMAQVEQEFEFILRDVLTQAIDLDLSALAQAASVQALQESIRQRRQAEVLISASPAAGKRKIPGQGQDGIPVLDGAACSTCGRQLGGSAAGASARAMHRHRRVRQWVEPSGSEKAYFHRAFIDGVKRMEPSTFP